ncbi:hypothetical protein Ais01nite_05110 [Asanoa ishikariensis]|uniref:DUF998 domain-containing protein n=1 Tax=Asanoa ishikariensis TaxID=137265 RepID=A0A1H3THB3_9ACTN|nr:hypothetical protein Ais01nite_05110 [Asanoa ishikariensis]SDZ49367.1 Protein of unknown function [Asanoa ishikariensis]
MPGWALVSAILAPIFLLAGLVLGTARQSASYSSTRDTISALGGLGATDRWIMVIGFTGMGICFILTGIGLRPAMMAGRVVMVFGGSVSLISAFFPQPVQGTSAMHGLVAGAAFVALAVWPAFAFRTDDLAPWSLRPTASLVATGIMIGLMFWFATELFNRGDQIGLTERFLAAAECLWPVVVVFNARQLAPVVSHAVTDEPG